MSKKKEVSVELYHPVYKFIHDNEFLLPVISSASLGFLNHGPKGLVLFGALGSVDVISKKWGYNLHLTEAVLGYSVCNSFGNYVIKGFGFALGPLISTGSIKVRDMGRIITPISGYIYGYRLGNSVVPLVRDSILSKLIGLPKKEIVESIWPEFETYLFDSLRKKTALIVASLGIFDEFLSYNNYTHASFFTSSIRTFVAYNSAMPSFKFYTERLFPSYCTPFTTILDNSFFINVIASSHIIFNLKDAKLYVHPSIILAENVYKVYSSVIASDQLHELIRTQYILSVTSSLFSTKMALMFDNKAQEAALSFLGLNNQNAVKYQELVDKAFMMIAFSLPYVFNKATDEMLNSYSKKKLEYIVNEVLNEKFFSKGVLSALKENRTENIVNKNIAYIQTEALEEHLPIDIEKIIDISSLISFMSQISSGVYSIGDFHKNDALDALAYSSLYNLFSNKVSAFFAKELEIIYPKIKEIESDIRLKVDYARLNYNSMDISDANDFVNEQRKEKTKESEKHNSQALTWKSIWSFCFDMEKLLELVVSYLIVGNQISLGNINQNMAKQAMTMLQAFSTMVSWESETVSKVSVLKESLTRIEEINARMNEAQNVVRVTPKYIYQKSDRLNILLKNVSVGVEEESRLHIDELYLNKKIIAVASASGGGKSTFFKALAQINKSNVWSTGEITYFTKNGQNLTSFMFSQSPFMLPQTTLLEIITYKTGVEAQVLKDDVADLLMQIKLDPSKDSKEDIVSWLDSKKNWFTYLSGGQKQKVGIVSLLLKKEAPDLILLDEVFAGLDHNSIKIVQHMLKEERFNKSMILIIDHEFASHNTEGFYDGLLFLGNGTAIISEMDAI